MASKRLSCAAVFSDGEGNPVRRFHFDAKFPEQYRSDIRTFIKSEYEKVKPTTFHEWHQLVSETQDCFCNPYQLLQDKIFKRIHKQTVLPESNKCGCDDGFCKRDLTAHLTYKEGQPLWNVDFTKKHNPFIVLNLALLSDEVADNIVSYYVGCVEQYFKDYFRVSRCCPVSVQYIQDIDLLLRITKSVCYDCLKLFNDSCYAYEE